MIPRNHQTSFASQEYANKGRMTRCEKFLNEIQAIVPWNSLLAVIEPHYPKGERGHPPIGCLRMLHIYLLQQWYTLADEALEDSLYDIIRLREFVGIGLGREPIPDATTLLEFHHLIEQNYWSATILQALNADLERRGLLMRAGTIVDATLKARIGVDAETGVAHTVINTAANAHDITQGNALLHSKAKDAYTDSDCCGIEKRCETQELNPDVQWHIALTPGKTQDGTACQQTQTIDQIE